MPWAVAGAAVAAGGAAYQANQAGKAAGMQARGAERNAMLQQAQFDRTRQDLSPYRRIGEAATDRLYRLNAFGGGSPDFSSFYESPDYQFRLGEGQKALERSAAARGGLLSGAQQKALQRHGQGLASTEFGNWYNRLAGLSSVGQNAAAQIGQFGANAAAGAGRAYQDAANYRAGGVTNSTNALVSGLGNALGFAGQYYGGQGPRGSGYRPQNTMSQGIDFDSIGFDLGG